MSLIGVVTLLRSRNAKVSAHFFERKLGFRREWDFQASPAHPMRICVSCNGVEVVLTEDPEEAVEGSAVYFCVSDPAKLMEEFSANGVSSLNGLEQSAVGHSFVVKDPNNNQLRFGNESIFSLNRNRNARS
jgi:predicted enzyme related to lactoylglutathione lyase